MKWFALFAVLLIFYILVYLIFTAAASLPPSVLSIIAALAVVCTAEWVISPPSGAKEAVRTISIPLLAIAAIIMRFVSGTAVFMRTEVDRKAK
ncbi:hypothetical protein [Sporosarcina trichiuri]|uniref:hypothetical protein n=1 Tax=Sporosarcina trichiuri TaxID=3056445 RepID=UPI00058F8188|nr:hypothetical protein [Sporosarcina sp. 0.2-SM1T-5]WJY28446.1 hypothetical protein QWT68_05545 [Sporosarcina sp. 0.2-SM1T-5]